jgi:hypothetical protein
LFILRLKFFQGVVRYPPPIAAERPELRVAKDVDVERVLSEAANLMVCDVEEFRRKVNRVTS